MPWLKLHEGETICKKRVRLAKTHDFIIFLWSKVTFSSFKEFLRQTIIDGSIGDIKIEEGLCLSKDENVRTEPCLGAHSEEEARSKSS